MLNTLFSGIFSSTTETIAVPQFLLCIAVALVIGIFLAAVYSYKTKYTKSFVVTLALLPAVTTGDSTTEVEMTSIIYGSGGMGGHRSMGGRNMGNGDMNGNEMGGPDGDMRGGPQIR